MHAGIFTYNQQSLWQLTFANVSELQCRPRQVEDMTTVLGNIPGKDRDRLWKMLGTDSINSNNKVVRLCSITKQFTRSCCIVTNDLDQDKYFYTLLGKTT